MICWYTSSKYGATLASLARVANRDGRFRHLRGRLARAIESVIDDDNYLRIRKRERRGYGHAEGQWNHYTEMDIIYHQHNHGCRVRRGLNEAEVLLRLEDCYGKLCDVCGGIHFRGWPFSELCGRCHTLLKSFRRRNDLLDADDDEAVTLWLANLIARQPKWLVDSGGALGLDS